MPVTRNQPEWMEDPTKPFKGIQWVYVDSGAFYGEHVWLKMIIQPLDGVRYQLGVKPEDAEDKHLHRVYELADQCIKIARENFTLVEFTLTVNFNHANHSGIEATLELLITKKD